MKNENATSAGNWKSLTPTQTRQIRGGVDNPDLRTKFVDCPDLRTYDIGLKINAVQAKF